MTSLNIGDILYSVHV